MIVAVLSSGPFHAHFPFPFFLAGPPRAEGGFTGGDGVGFGRGIAQLFKNTAGACGLAVDEEFRGAAQRLAAEIVGRAVALDAVEEGRDLDEFGAHRDEAIVDEGTRGGGGGQLARGARGARLNHGGKDEESQNPENRSKYSIGSSGNKIA